MSEIDVNKQNIIDYYESLQVEYLINEIRRKIYPSKSDKLYYLRTMKRKEEKIKDISSKNNLLSIFNSEVKKHEYISKIYNPIGLPNFGKYQVKHDSINYYSTHSTVKVYENVVSDPQDYLLGVIGKYNAKTNVVTVHMNDGNTREIESSLITRIL